MQPFILTSQTPVLWRSKDIVQLGLDPQQALHLPADIAQSLLKQASGNPLPLMRTYDITPAHSIALNRENLAQEELVRRFETEIVIHGAGRMGMTIAVLLANAGFPTIRIFDKKHITQADVTSWGPSRTDIGSRRDYIAYLLIERIHRGTWPRMLRQPTTASRTLTLMCPDPVADWPWFSPQLTDELIASDKPHIVVASGTDKVHFSSVIVPGKTACMRCHDAHLVDHDPSWALISSQLIGRPSIDVTPSNLILFAAHTITQLIQEWTNDQHKDINRLWEISFPELSKTWIATTQHPACGCGWNI